MTSIIAGLPRSRTAWLSVWLNQPPLVSAYHDAVGDVDGHILTPNEYVERVTSEPTLHHVDCSNAILLRPSHAMVLNPSVIVRIDRDHREASRAWMNHLGPSAPAYPNQQWDRILRARDQFFELFASKVRLTINYDDLRDDEVCLAIWKLVCQDAPCSGQRLRLCQQMRVNEMI